MSSFARMGVVAALALCAWPSFGAERGAARSIKEDEVRRLSAERYTAALRLSCLNGWRFSRESIESGYRRHYEEMRLSLIDEGCAIAQDPAAPRLRLVRITMGRASKDAASAPACFRARWSDG